ncbi:autophagy-related protein 17 [Achaetomium macrosporum]|uniref:Autophagy-related protein 17 n=1 Tax=Achaetomium macrosporum TaxID=79813 RepID=A0AAN7C221_9PEZI|nr:autophagy-related protein 17 [Achaetomium macrosporum]
MATSRPASSAEPRARPISYHDPHSPEFDVRDVPVEVLVRHLLAAKQSLSSMALVLRAHDLATNARQMHEDSVILSAQTGSVRQLIEYQMRLLRRARRGMGYAYDHGRRDFKHLIRTLDAVNGQLEQTMEMLRKTRVERVFRPPGEEEKCLMDFVDENSVEAMRDALKGSIAELQAALTSFDGDLLRFDRDLRLLSDAMSAAPSPASPASSSAYQPIPHLLASLSNHSHAMAELLTSLNKHFDMCVKAVRATEGGAALARRRAAEATGNGDPVSISGVITEQESHLPDLDPMDPQELAEIVEIVVHDAPEVDEVVAEIQGVLQQMELEFGMLKEQADQIRATYMATMAAFQVLEDIGSRLRSYVAAQSEFEQRWDDEKEIIAGKLQEMDAMRRFYEGYASAYGSLLLEVERRRVVEEKIQNTLRKAKENVDNLVQADRKQREHFRQEVGEFLPTDLWVGMNDPLKRWELVPVTEEAAPDSGAREELRTPTLGKPAVKGKAPARRMT